MGLNIVSTSMELRKHYLPRADGSSVYSRMSFNNDTWGVQDCLEGESLEEVIELYGLAKTENIGLLYGTPKGNPESFYRNKESLLSGSVKFVLCDIEWTMGEDSPVVAASLKVHADFILNRLGFPNPGSIGYVIKRSSSNGVVDYEDKGKPYRFHLWLQLDKAERIEDIQSACEHSGLLDTSVFNITQPIFIREGSFHPDVERTTDTNEVIGNEGRCISLTELGELPTHTKTVRFNTAKSIRGVSGGLAASYKRISEWYGKELPLKDSEELLKVFYDYGTSKNKRGVLSLDGYRNEDLYYLIHYFVQKEGSGERAIELISSDERIQADWTDSQLWKKEEWAHDNIAKKVEFGGIEAHYKPDKIVKFNIRNLAELEDLDVFLNSGTYLILSPEGSGKTELMERIFEKVKLSVGRPIRILSINYRQAPISQNAKDWGADDYQTYKSYEATAEDLSNKQRKERFLPDSEFLVIGIQSLANLVEERGVPHYDIVHIDEIEHCLEDLFTDPELFQEEISGDWKMNRCFEVLKKVCIKADLVIGADAKAGGILSGQFLKEIHEGKNSEKILIRNRADYIADKEIEVYSSREELLLELVRELKETKNCVAVHSSFGNDTEEKKIEGWEKALVKMGVPKKIIHLAYPSMFKGKEAQETYKTSPATVIPQLIEMGKRCFWNSPFNGVAWSCKLEEFETAYAFFTGTFVDADDIKQFVRRFRMVKKIKVFISPFVKPLDKEQIEKALRELENGDDYEIIADYLALKGRVDLQQKLRRESIKQRFIQLCKEGGAFVDFRTKIFKEAEVAETEALLAECLEEGKKEELARLAKKIEEVKAVKKFRMLNGEEVDLNLISQALEELDQMLTYNRLYKDGSKHLLELWGETEKSRRGMLEGNGYTQEQVQLILINLKLMNSIDADFTSMKGLSLREFLSDSDKKEISFECNDNAFPILKNYLQQHPEQIKKNYFNFLRITEITEKKILKKLCKVLYLDYSYHNKKFADYEETKTSVRKRLEKKHKLKGKLAEKNQRIDEIINAKDKLTKDEKIWFECDSKRIVISKRLTMPEDVFLAVQEREAVFEDLLEKNCNFDVL
jgi:hypothetical protein